MTIDFTNDIIGASIEVHKVLGGPGLLESVYEEALVRELILKGLKVARQVSVPIFYKGQKISTHLVIDLLVENSVIVEVKATKEHFEIFESQLLTYLRLSNCKIGLIINFGSKLMKDGIRRIVNNF